MLDGVLRKTPLRADAILRARGGLPAGRRRRKGGHAGRGGQGDPRRPAARPLPPGARAAGRGEAGRRPGRARALPRRRPLRRARRAPRRAGARPENRSPLVPAPAGRRRGAPTAVLGDRGARHPAQRRLRLHASAGRSAGGSTTCRRRPRPACWSTSPPAASCARTARPSAAPPSCWRSARRRRRGRRAGPQGGAQHLPDRQAQDAAAARPRQHPRAVPRARPGRHPPGRGHDRSPRTASSPSSS